MAKKRGPRSQQSEAWQAWYKTARWQKLRWSVLVRDLFTCRMCKLTTGITSQLVADHIIKHEGNEQLFWDPDNIQCLCKQCHDSRKQAIEKGGRPKQAIGTDGWPAT